MSHDRYPKAIWKGDGQTSGTFVALAPARIVLHTTETRGVPSYDGGASAPHLTYQPTTRLWTQHTRLDMSARAMRNAAGGAETNRQGAIQIEIVCYSNKTIADTVGGLWVGNLFDAALQDLADFIIWYGDILPYWPERVALNYAQAAAPGFRLAADVWEGYKGVVGHQHVPENTHWDPGAFPWGKLMTLLNEEDDMPLTQEQEEALNALVAARKAAASPVYQPDMDAMTEAGIYQGTNPSEPITAAKLARFFRRLADSLKVSIE